MPGSRFDKADDHRIAAGKLLLEAKGRVQSGEVKMPDGRNMPWEKWCVDNVKRSQGDIRKVIALVSHADPEAERAAQNARRRAAAQGDQQERAPRAVSQPDPVNHFSDCPTNRPPAYPPGPCDCPEEDLLAFAILQVRRLDADDLKSFAGWFSKYCNEQGIHA